MSAKPKSCTTKLPLLGESQAMRKVFDLIQKSSHARASILITGESGTGKEMVARQIHHESSESKGPFVAVNCAAIPGNLIESELFGHVKGAFTDAREDKKGLFEEAENGTLFLDEIGDLDLVLQAKILRAVQEKEIRRVGAKESKKLNLRFIFATHRNLREMVESGEFREDLYYRINVIPISIPPLRQRPEDIPSLANHFLLKVCHREKMPLKILTHHALNALVHHFWQGNVRELENTIERTVIMTDAHVIHSEMICFSEQFSKEPYCEQLYEDDPSLEVLRNRYIKYVLQKVGDNKTKASEILGVSRRSLYRNEHKKEGSG